MRTAAAPLPARWMTLPVADDGACAPALAVPANDDAAEENELPVAGVAALDAPARTARTPDPAGVRDVREAPEEEEG